MRRTYDVLNILQMALVLVFSDKCYTYDPYMLEGKEAAEVHDSKAQLSNDEKLVREMRHRVQAK